MKACIFQPPYSRDVSLSDSYFDYKLDLLKQCDDSLDIIVLPEYSDVPCATGTLEETLYYHNLYIDTLLEACSDTAKRCNALVFVNALSKENTGYRNTICCMLLPLPALGRFTPKPPLIPPLPTYNQILSPCNFIHGLF